MKKGFLDRLPADVYSRFCECHTRREDLPVLVDCYWASMVERGDDKKGFKKEDALVSVLDWLDCNSCWFDLTRDEYNSLIA